MVFSWLRTRRRNRLIRQPFPHKWRAALARYVRHDQFLNSTQRDRLEAFVQVFVAEKEWVGDHDFQLTDEIKVAIAGYAAVMTLGLPEPYFFDRLKTLIVFDDQYLPGGIERQGYLVGRPGPRLGEALQSGPIKLSWAEISGQTKLRPGNNLVFHEFAHHVDGLDGAMDGTPAIGDPDKRRTWNHVIDQEFARLQMEASQGQPTLLDPYGTKSRAEFLAVATECFLERPHAMRSRHLDLYQILADFYCQDVVAWLPDAHDAT